MCLAHVLAGVNPYALSKASKSAAGSVAIQEQLKICRNRQRALETEKRLGLREIDVIDDDIAKIEQEKVLLKQQLPRKKFLRLF